MSVVGGILRPSTIQGEIPLVLFLFECAEAERTFLGHAAFVSSNLPTLSERRLLGPSWRLPLPHPADRMPLNTGLTVQRHGENCNPDRTQSFL